MSFSPQIRFKMQKDGEPVWDQTTIDRLWVTTQREAMIESGPPAAQASPPAAPQEKFSCSENERGGEEIEPIVRLM